MPNIESWEKENYHAKYYFAAILNSLMSINNQSSSAKLLKLSEERIVSH